MLTSAQKQLADDSVKLLQGIAANIPNENFQDFNAEVQSQLAAEQTQGTPPTPVDLAAQAIQVVDDAAQITGNQKFINIMNIINGAAEDLEAGTLNIFKSFFTALKLKKAANATT